MCTHIYVYMFYTMSSPKTGPGPTLSFLRFGKGHMGLLICKLANLVKMLERQTEIRVIKLKIFLRKGLTKSALMGSLRTVCFLTEGLLGHSR